MSLGVKSINNNDLGLSLDHLMGLHKQYTLNSDNMTCMRLKHILHPFPEGETLYDPIQSSAPAFSQSVSKWIFCNCRFLISFASLFPPILLKTVERLCSEQEGKKVAFICW